MKPLVLACLSLASLLLGPASASEASVWNGWFGPGREARAQDFKTPESWPEKLPQVWRVEVGEGYATPLVVGDRVFQHARQQGKEVLWCLERSSGRTIWKQAVPVTFQAGINGERHGLGPKSTPTCGGGRVFTLSITGVLRAWSAVDGEPLWTRDFRERFDVSHPYWGMASSPILDGDRLFAHTGSCEDGALFCIDPATGKDLWVRTEEANCYSSPRIEVLHGVRQLVGFNHDGLCGIDVSDGKLLWKYSYPHRGNKQNTPTPARHGNLFILGAEDRGMFAVEVGREGDDWSAKVAWRHREASLDMGSPILHDGLAYGFSHFKSGQFFCLDPATGEVLWKGDPRMGENAQFLSLPDHLLALTNDGLCRILEGHGKKYEAVRTYEVAPDKTWTAPALVGDQLFIKDLNHLTVWSFGG